jgi:hypothetical protein
MKLTDLLLLAAAGIGAWYLLKGPGAISQSSPVTNLGTQIYNDPTSVFQRMKAASGDGYQLLNNGQWQQLLSEFSTLSASAGIDPTERMTLYTWWPLAFPNSGVQLAGLEGWAA